MEWKIKVVWDRLGWIVGLFIFLLGVVGIPVGGIMIGVSLRPFGIPTGLAWVIFVVNGLVAFMVLGLIIVAVQTFGEVLDEGERYRNR